MTYVARRGKTVLRVTLIPIPRKTPSTRTHPTTPLWQAGDMLTLDHDTLLTGFIELELHELCTEMHAHSQTWSPFQIFPALKTWYSL